MRVVRNDAEMVQWLWEQCGHDYTGNEEHARNTWFAYLEDGDNWRRLDEVPRWWCEIDVGETGHIEFIRLLDDVAGRVADNDRLLQQLKSSEAREAALENEVNMLRGQRNDAERRIAAITEGAGCGP